MRFVSYSDRKKVAASLRDIYTAVDEEDARQALEYFATSPMGKKCPAAVRAWQPVWERFIFLPGL